MIFKLLFTHSSFKKVLLIGIFSFWMSHFLQAQENLQLSLSDAIQKAMNENKRIQSQIKGEQIAKADVAKTKALYLPQVTLSETWITTNSPLNSFGTRLNQQIVKAEDFNPALLNSPDAITNFNTRLDVRQPIFNLGGVYGRKAAEFAVSASQMQTQRTKSAITLEVKKTYFQIQLTQSAQKVLGKAIATAKAFQKQVEDGKQEGYAREGDVLEVRLKIAELENQLMEVQNNEKSAQEYLKLLLGVDANTQITTTDSLAVPTAFADNQATVSENRSDFKAMQYGISAQENMLKSYQNQFVPRLNAFGAFEFNDDIPFSPQAGNWLVGASLQWTIFNGYDRQASMQKTRAEIEKNRLDYTQMLDAQKMELQNTSRSLQLYAQKIKVADLGIAQVQENLRVKNDRFAEGLEQSTIILELQTKLAEKQLQKLQAIYGYHSTLFYKDFLVGD